MAESKHIPFKALRRTTDPAAHLFKRFIPSGGSDPDSVIEEDSKYPANRFLVPSTNQQGQSTRIQCKASPQVGRALQEFVACRKFGFRTDSDVFRFCLQEGMRILHELEPDVSTFYMRVQIEMDALRDDELKNLAHTYLEGLEKQVRTFTDAGEWAAARTKVLTALANWKSVKEDSPWPRKVLTEIRSRFKHIIEMPVKGSGGSGGRGIEEDEL